MNPLFLLVISSLFFQSVYLGVEAAKAKPVKGTTRSQIIVMGLVYCDICSNNTFSRHSYFIPGHISQHSLLIHTTIVKLYIYIYMLLNYLFKSEAKIDFQQVLKLK